MRNNLYVSVRGTLENGETVDEGHKALEGVLFVGEDPLADAPPGAVMVACGMMGAISREMLMCAVLAVRDIAGPWKLLWMALKAAVMGDRVYEKRIVNTEREGGDGDGNKPE